MAVKFVYSFQNKKYRFAILEIVEKTYNLQAFEKFEVQGALRASSGAYFR